MLSLAASFAFLVASVESATPNPEMQARWAELSHSLVQIGTHSGNRGYAAMIDRRGFFIAYANLVDPVTPMGTTADGAKLFMKAVAFDEPTQLVLLQSTMQPANMRPVVVAKPMTEIGKDYIAAMSTGPVSGDYSNVAQAGVVSSSQRYLPLNEVRLESQRGPIGGAFVFTSKNELVGVLGATLAQGKEQNQTKSTDYGPGGLTVAYAIGPEVLQRVVSGFLTPSHKVAHPSIGLFFKDNPAGTTVVSVAPGSNAAKAGFQPGDVILAMGDQPVKGAIQFASALFRLQVGSTQVIRVQRSGMSEPIDLPVVVGVYEAPASNRGPVPKFPSKPAIPLK